MLILVFRGVFLLGILSWYSTHVWKMIDTYFKEKFDTYLQQEFEKNPRMREHVETQEKLSREIVKNELDEDFAKRKTPISPIDHRQESCKGVGNLGEEVCSIDGSNMGKTAGDDTGTGSASLVSNGEETIDDSGSSESEVIEKKGVTLTRSLVDEVFTEDLSVTNKKSLKPALIEAEIMREASKGNVTAKTATPEADFSEVTKSQVDDSAATSTDESKHLTRKKKKKSSLRKKWSLRSKVEEENEAMEKKKKQRVKTISFTEKDFRDAKIHGNWKDNDFMEFDDEDEDANREPPEGILVSQLPFKPRADIGKLERVTEDEFCPLTLEDEADCDEVRTWP